MKPSFDGKSIGSTSSETKKKRNKKIKKQASSLYDLIESANSRRIEDQRTDFMKGSSKLSEADIPSFTSKETSVGKKFDSFVDSYNEAASRRLENQRSHFSNPVLPGLRTVSISSSFEGSFKSEPTSNNSDAILAKR